jgi:hypothetical protein
MKKLQLLGLIVIVLCVAGCEDELTSFDVTLKNDCGELIKVALTGSNDMPADSSYREVENGKSITFTEQSGGKYYIHLLSPSKVPLCTEPITVDASRTYKIFKQDGTYKVQWFTS